MPEDNPFQQELTKRNPFSAEMARRTPGMGPLSAFGRQAMTGFLNNVMALPSGVGKFMDSPLVSTPGLDPMRIGVAQALQAVPSPTVQDIAAGGMSLPAFFPGGESPSESFSRHRSEIAAEEEGMSIEHPFATRAGNVAGDVLTLVSGRAPFARSINRAESALSPRRSELFFGGATPEVKPVQFLLDRTLTSAPMRRLARGAGRAGETGFEAAVLEVMKGEDPLETAAFAAGGQAVGSSLLALGQKTGLLTGSPMMIGLKLGAAAFATGSIIQILKSAIPGGDDHSLDSIESGFNKVMYGMILGAGASLAGGGRLRGGPFAEMWPKLSDALATLPRAGTLSLLTEWTKAEPVDQQNIETVLAKLSEDPEYFGGATERLGNAITGGGESLVSEIDSLLEESAEFRERMFSIAPPRLGNGEDQR